jgi:hypothetical protein
MPGAVMQMALVGAADVVLTGSPEISFFKVLNKRYTHYAAESVQMAFKGMADFGKRVTCPITRSGDLVSKIWLQITLPDLANFQIAPTAAATSTVPSIVSARFTSSTTANVVVQAPTTSVADSLYRYVATVTSDDPDASEEVFYSATTTIGITGLAAGMWTYTVTVARQTMEDATTVLSTDDESESVQIIALRWANSVGHALLRNVELQLGGARIDKHESEFYDILSELNLPEEKRAGFERMVGKYRDYDIYDNSFSGSRTLFVPLHFFFCKAPSLSIPIVALAFHEINLSFDFRDWFEVIKSDVPINMLQDTRGATPSMDCKLYAEMYLLDTAERLRFSSMPQEMIIEVCQFHGDHPIIINPEEPNLTRKIALNFSHPVKELIFVYNHSDTYNATLTPSNYPTNGNDYFNVNMPGPDDDDEPITSAYLQINGSNRNEVRPGEYYRLVQPYQSHLRIPNKKIYVYSFSLNADDIQPSGSLNWSRVDQAHLVVTLNPKLATNVGTRGRIRCFGIAYNLLRISSGLGGLAFAGG